MESRETAVRRLAEAQHGLVFLDQLLQLGFSLRTIRYRVASGFWLSVHPGVIQPNSSGLTWHGHLLSACKWAKTGVASHRSAGRLWGLVGCDDDAIEITVVRCRLAPRSGIKVHFTDRLLDHHITARDCIPTTSVERTLLDLCGSIPELRAASAIDDALRRELTTVRQLDELVGEVARRGRRGCGVLRRLVREREGLPAVPHSPLETKFFQLIIRSSLPKPTPQYVVRDRGEFVARLDFAYPEAKLGIECHSQTWHSSKAQRDRDFERLQRLTALGWTIEFITNEDMNDHPQPALDRIGKLYREARPDLF